MNLILKSVLLPALSTSVLLMASLNASAASKALTNADVIAMIKAGLSESTIILAIRQENSNFDTAPQSLILLKKQGVSAKMLDAMLNKKLGAASPSQPTSIAAATAEFTGIRTLIDGQFVPMKRSKAQNRYSSGWLSVVTAFADSKGRAVLEGTTAKLRLKPNNLTFEVALPSDVDPDDYVKVVHLETKADRRQIETSRDGFSISDGARSKDGFPKDRVMATDFEDTGAKTPSGKAIYRVKVTGTMIPGEYAIVRASTNDTAGDEELSDRKTPAANYYDFGIDMGS